MKKIYVASPIGFSELGIQAAYPLLVKTISNDDVELLDPWQLPEDMQSELERLLEQTSKMEEEKTRREAWRSWSEKVGQRNAQMIDECDLLVACLDGVDVDSGTASEIGYAAARAKPVIGYRGDFRLSADNEGSAVNLQVEYFIGLHGGKIVRDLASLASAVEQQLSHA